FLKLLVLTLLARRERAGRVQLVVNVLLLQAAQPLELVGDGVEGLEHFRLELGLDRGKRHGIFQIVFVEIGFRNLIFLAALLATAGGGGGLERRRGGRRRRRRHGLQRLSGTVAGHAGRTFTAGDSRGALFGVRAGIGRFEIDNVAEKDFSFVQLVAPNDNG